MSDACTFIRHHQERLQLRLHCLSLCGSGCVGIGVLRLLPSAVLSLVVELAIRWSLDGGGCIDRSLD